MPRLRKRQSRSPLPLPPQERDSMPKTTVSSPAISTTLDSIQITPRTPRVMHSDHAAVEEVEMSLLEEDDRRRAAAGFVDGNGHIEAKPRVPLSPEDKRAMVLLCILCTWLSSPPRITRPNYCPLRTCTLSRRSHPGRSCMCQLSSSILSSL
jgi:hypothetical protein